MNPLTAWFKGSIVWLAIIAGLVLVLMGEKVVISNTKASLARAETALAGEKLDRSQVNEERSRAALRYVEAVAIDQAAHAATQQEISSALTAQTDLRRDADARVSALTARMHDGAKALRATLDSAAAEARAAAVERAGDRPETVFGLLADGGQLLAEGGEVVRACRDLVSQRDAEVAALRAVIDNDRALAAGTASVLLPAGPQKLPNVLR